MQKLNLNLNHSLRVCVCVHITEHNLGTQYKKRRDDAGSCVRSSSSRLADLHCCLTQTQESLTKAAGS